MSERRVAIQLVSTGGVYGAERVLLELATYLQQQGWESHVVALEGHGAGPLIDRARSAGLAGQAFVSSGKMPLQRLISRLRQLLESFPRAVVHSHGYKPDILLSMLGVPRRWACVATCHNWISETTKMRALEVLDRYALRRFDHVVAVSDEVAQKLLRGGVERRRVSRIDNGVAVPPASSDARARLRAELRIPPDAPLLVQIGRLARSKRNDLLLEAVAALPRAFEAHVLLVGEGERRAYLAELAQARGIGPRVHLCGYRSDVSDILVAADLLALTSDIEAMPIVILEAMATRCPIVSTCVGAIPQVLEAGRDAWIVPPDDADRLTAALHEALSEPQLARRRAGAAYDRFVQRYSREAMGAAYLKLYDALWTQRHWP
jgi:glycosyltransferase involved in cell wall biosynthesis